MKKLFKSTAQLQLAQSVEHEINYLKVMGLNPVMDDSCFLFCFVFFVKKFWPFWGQDALQLSRALQVSP